MLLKSKGIVIDQFFIPPFSLEEGELIILYLYGGGHYYDLELKLKNILTGKDKTGNVIINKPLWLVQRYDENEIKKLMFPITVAQYIKKYANTKNKIAESVYQINGIDQKTKVDTLSYYLRKILDIYIALSHSNYLVFDLNGVGPFEANEIFIIVKGNVKDGGGAAILIDKFDDLNDDCTKFISVEIS